MTRLQLSTLILQVYHTTRHTHTRRDPPVSITPHTHHQKTTDPELKGRWLIPRRQKGDFWACWDERDEAAFGGVCRWPLVVFGSTGPKKIHFFFPGASGLVFLSLTSGLVFLTFFFRLVRQQELRCRDLRDTRSPNPLSFLWDQHGNTPVWRLEERPPL